MGRTTALNQAIALKPDGIILGNVDALEQAPVIQRAAMLGIKLVGWHVAGLPGALVATAAICAPSCTLSYFVARVWERFRGAPWRGAVEAGLAPITVGLVLATGWLVARGAQDTSWVAALITAAVVGLVTLTRVNPIWLVAAAGALGILGFV